jgi:hypothetical protein
MQNIRGCDAICSNQIALYMRFYIPRRPAHTACVYTSPLPTFYGINHTGFRRYGRLPSMKTNYEVRSEIQLLLALVFVLVVIPCTFKYTVPVFWQLYFSGVEVMVCGLVVDKKESECFVHLPRSVMRPGARRMMRAVNESPSPPLSSQ